MSKKNSTKRNAASSHKKAPARQSKKDLVMGVEKKRPRLPVLLVISLVTVGTVLAAVWMTGGFNAGANNALQSTSLDDHTVVYPVTMFADGKAQHFSYQTADGKTIRYFILKSSDGIVRAAFDACDVCWPAGKGYYQEGDNMVCRNCGRRFASIRINEVKGGCNPAPLARRIKDGQLIITVDDIIGGKSYFDFS